MKRNKTFQNARTEELREGAEQKAQQEDELSI
jgi:hypothetical protein